MLDNSQNDSFDSLADSSSDVKPEYGAGGEVAPRNMASSTSPSTENAAFGMHQHQQSNTSSSSSSSSNNYQFLNINDSYAYTAQYQTPFYTNSSPLQHNQFGSYYTANYGQQQQQHYGNLNGNGADLFHQNQYFGSIDEQDYRLQMAQANVNFSQVNKKSNESVSNSGSPSPAQSISNSSSSTSSSPLNLNASNSSLGHHQTIGTSTAPFHSL